MLTETHEAPDRVAAMLRRDDAAYAALVADLHRRDPAFLVTVARGSSDHAALYLATLAGVAVGRVTASLPPSLVTRYRAALSFERAFVIAISQSGQSPDLVQTLATAGAGGALTAAIVNRPGAPLRRSAAYVLPQRAGPERAVAATKSTITTMAVAARMIATWARDEVLLTALPRMPERLAAALQCDWTPALAHLSAAPHLYVIGRGLGFAVAAESALKLKETAGVLAEAVSAAEVQHGPKAVIGPDFPVLAYGLADPGGEDAADVAAVLGHMGACPMVASHAPVGHGMLRLPLPAPLHPLLDPIVALLAFYPLAEALARARGRDPDRPPGLAKVTRTL